MDGLRFPTFLSETVLPLFTALGCGAGSSLLIDWTISQDGVLVTEVSYLVGDGKSGWKGLERVKDTAHSVLALAAMKRALDESLGVVVGAVQQRVDPEAVKGHFVFQNRRAGPVLRLHTAHFQVSIAEDGAVMHDLDALVMALART